MGAAFPEDEPTGAASAAVLDGRPACSREADEFTARHKGSNLEFPETFKRQQAKNHRLWQKVGLLQDSCTPEEEAYALKLRSTFLDGGVATLSRHDVAQRLEEVDLVTSSMDHLLWKEMEGRAVDESLGWEALCKRTKLLEECQLLISRLQEELAQLQQGAQCRLAPGKDGGPLCRAADEARGDVQLRGGAEGNGERATRHGVAAVASACAAGDRR